MNRIQNEAWKILSTPDFFKSLRNILYAFGLTDEVKYAVGLFLVLASRFRPNPLRLHIEEETEGSATFLVRTVGQLLSSGSITGYSGNMNKAWNTFDKWPEKKVFFIPPRSTDKLGQPRIEVHSDRLTRVDRTERDGRITEEPRHIKRSFVCISAEKVWDWREQTRWLTMRLKTPVTTKGTKLRKPEASEMEIWHAIQDLIRQRMRLPIHMPVWEEILIEKIRMDRFSIPHIPALLVLWKTISILRSFRERPISEPPKVIRPNFEDYALTAAVMAGLFREGRAFPSAQRIFEEISTDGYESSVQNPLNGKGKRCHRKSAPIQYDSLLPEGAV